MLKNAAEMAEAARAAKAEADELARAEREDAELKEAEAQQLRERLDRAHKLFETQALAAARDGELRITVAGKELSLKRLAEQGFHAQRLNRRLSFEEHLCELVSTKRKKLTLVCEQAVADCRVLNSLGGVALLHRNPLMSLMETLWRRGELAEPFDIDVFLDLARRQGDVDPFELQAAKPRLEEALRRFADFKAVETKYDWVKWENQSIPADANEATYVSWDEADDGEGQNLEFSAALLKWISVQWRWLSESLGEYIEEAAQKGETSVDVFVWRADGPWYRSWHWPPDVLTSELAGC